MVAEPARPPLAPAALADLARTYETATPQAIIEWAVATYGTGMTLACSFGGPSGMALLDMTLRIKPDVPVFYLDTDFLFPETHALVDVVARKYGITPHAVRPSLSPAKQAANYGEALWTRDPDACCDLRKVAPQRDYLRQFTAWLTGIRRDQASTRRATPVIQWDAQFGLAKISPLAGWDERQVWAYIIANDIPYNALHDQGFPSIGCTNCTRAVAAGEDPRAGRWSGFAKVECGIHLPGNVATATPTVEPPVAEPATEVPPPAPATPGNDLLSLGVGKGSKVEQIKATSQYMRGQIVEQMHSDATHFTEDQTQLLKMHGTYQQDDRDIRRARTGEKAYQFMVRSRIPGGMLTAEQYLAEDAIADTYANGTLRVTTRQGLQLHGILKGDLQAAIHDINATLLTTLAACGDVNRNVMACPAPVASRAQAQVEAIAHTLAERLTPQSPAYHEIWIDGEQHSTVTAPGAEVVEPLYGPSYLPRKFKIGVAYPGDNCVDVYTQDIGLVAEVQDDQLVGFTVLIGGGMGMTHGKTTTYPRVADPLCFVPAEQIYQVAETIISIQRDYGDRQNRKHARMKYLVAERGVAWFREEVERRMGFALADPHPVRWRGVEDHLGWHKQADGRWFLGLLVENGRIRDTEAVRMRSGLRHAIERFKPGIRLTGQQNIMLTDIPTRQKAPLVALLASYGIVTKPDGLGIARFAMACPALPTCGLALAEAERVAPEIVAQVGDYLRAIGLDGERLSIRMTGCPNGCARPYMGDIGIVGRSKDLYALFLGGDWANTRLNELYADAVPMQDLLPTLQPLLRLWRDERKARETFGDFCHRIGLAALRERVAPPPDPLPTAVERGRQAIAPDRQVQGNHGTLSVLPSPSADGEGPGVGPTFIRRTKRVTQGFTVWLTGLSGAGKSTIAAALTERIAQTGQGVEVLDGDEVRTHLSKGLGFSREDRDTNIRRIAFVASLLTRHGVAVITAAISPYEQARAEAREMIRDFVEVYVACPIDELVKRDVKGLYAKAMRGEIGHFTGISDPYEAPRHPDVQVDSSTETVAESVDRIYAYLQMRGYVPASE